MGDITPSTKRIKLSLEPSLEHKAVDITDTGEEILKDQVPLQEKLMQNVDRIWFERGDWRDISESKLETAIDTTDDTESPVQADTTETPRPNDPLSNAMAPPPGLDIIRLRESVINKLFHAKSEIDVALDVINILAAGNRPTSAPKDLVLPSESLHATYVSKPKPTTKAQLEAAQLTLGLKRKQQKTAAEFLKTRAAALRTLVDKEHAFWEEAMNLRGNNWLMQASGTGSSSFLIQYGFSDVGSEFKETSVGEMARMDDDDTNGDASSDVRLTLPHNVPQKTSVKIHHDPSNGFGLYYPQTDSDRMYEPTPAMQNNKDLQVFHLHTASGTDVQRQLQDAQATVFDAELFAEILAEAQTLSSNVRFGDNEITINIDGQMDLSIQKRDIQRSETDNLPSNSSMMPVDNLAGSTVNIALRLLLIQRHRFNIWKTRARLLPTNRKARQLLAAIGEPGTTGSLTGGATTGNGANQSPAMKNVRPLTMQRSLPLQDNPAFPHEVSAAVPVLTPALSMTRFWAFFNRIRRIVYDAIDPLCGEGGVALSVHYKLHDLYSVPDQSLHDAYPSYGELAVTLSISVYQGPSIHFILGQSGTITASLPQTTVTLTGISEFEALLLREINLICLRMACKEANDVIQTSSLYQMATDSEKSRFLWKVDQIEECVHGSICISPSNDSTTPSKQIWKSTKVQLLRTRVPCYDTSSSLTTQAAYELQFQIGDDVHPLLIAKSYTKEERLGDGFNFQERVRLTMEKLLANHTHVKS
ncbi:subunit 17 of mediator complex-domain-containing protein [Radiomyces spectabilis]|uniref:subunit 17 of mediator complex-domain-containing protein n=1 Tax=Radiomyces spectabilis TaxID=64574 RepID=UPI00221E549B|nr:subunit 17 of mediator complex-domain-containing protein [Radiomyces spectabilis]KAI8371699.1 subunit 17 of mediator complex-domain-containing protein [Radiomyces spectabilis]